MIRFKGSEAVGRSNIAHAVSHTDAPVVALARESTKATAGEITQIALSVEKVTL